MKAAELFIISIMDVGIIKKERDPDDYNFLFALQPKETVSLPNFTLIPWP